MNNSTVGMNIKAQMIGKKEYIPVVLNEIHASINTINGEQYL
jgi:hypothetical protein